MQFLELSADHSSPDKPCGTIGPILPVPEAVQPLPGFTNVMIGLTQNVAQKPGPRQNSDR